MVTNTAIDLVYAPPALRAFTRAARLVAGALAFGALGFHLLAASAVADEAKKQITIAFIPGIASDPFFKAMELGARNKAKELGVNLMWQGSASDYSPQTQMPFVDAALTNGVDALILVPTDPNAMQPAVARAESMKIPVITVDTTVADQSYLTSFITGDNIDGGHKAAETLAELIGRKGKVFIMSGSPSATTDVARENGFREAIKKFPDIEVVGIRICEQPAGQCNLGRQHDPPEISRPRRHLRSRRHQRNRHGRRAAERQQGGAGEARRLRRLQGRSRRVEGRHLHSAGRTAAGEGSRPRPQYAYDKITGKDVGSIQKTVVIPNVVITKENLADTEKYMYVQ